MSFDPIGVVLISLGVFIICVAFGWRDELERKKPVMTLCENDSMWALGTRGARNSSHAYIEYNTPTYQRYINSGWVMVGVLHSQVGWRDRIFAHLVLPKRLRSGVRAKVDLT